MMSLKYSIQDKNAELGSYNIRDFQMLFTSPENCAWD